jgi:hypothetical protein
LEFINLSTDAIPNAPSVIIKNELKINSLIRSGFHIYPVIKSTDAKTSIIKKEAKQIKDFSLMSLPSLKRLLKNFFMGGSILQKKWL